MKLKDKIAQDFMYWIGDRGDIMIPNYYFDFWEMDIIRIRRSGLVYEYEIKTSRSDYFNDFKKEFGGRYSPLCNKHEHLKLGKRRCNRFFFVVPEGLITKDELPDYAGLIYHQERGFKNICEGKLIQKKFSIDYEVFARKLSFREQIMKVKFRNHQEELDDLRSEIRTLNSIVKQLRRKE